MVRFLGLSLILSGSVFAQPLCLPSMSASSLTASPLYTHISKNGACVWWYCYLSEFSEKYPLAIQKNAYCGLPAELSKVGSRVDTIRKAPDPLKSLQDAPKRFTILPLSAPLFQALRSETGLQ